MNFSELSFDFETVRWMLTAVIGIYAWFVGRQSASTSEMVDLRTRVVSLELQMQQVPNQAQMHELSARMERLIGRVEAVAESVQPIARSLDRMNDYLLTQK